MQLSLRDPAERQVRRQRRELAEGRGGPPQRARKIGLKYVTALGEAAFYGPKADFMVRDCLGREWQLGTVQLDYNLPERFQLEYIGADNHAHRPVMIHRAPFGSMERFVGVLIEHFAGAFPLWLAPEQVRVLPLSDKSLDYAQEIERRFRDAGFRVKIDTRNSKVQAKIRDAQLELVPYMLVVGPKEAEQQAVALRDRIDGDLGTMPTTAAIDRLREEVTSRKIRQVAKSTFQNVEERLRAARILMARIFVGHAVHAVRLS